MKKITDFSFRLLPDDANGCGTLLAEEAPPVITMATDMRMEYSGNDVQLNCRVEGRPMPNVEWFLEGVLVQNGGNYTVCTVEVFLVKCTWIA